ncbi:MAG: class I SAM-dependent methyltransferase [Proteobacteria bacterium]|nr:class I SAM-dependent methyltransferase [Pseudomonadota bacterium]
MQKLLESVLRGLVKKGRLVVTWPDHSTRSYGPGNWKEAQFAIRDAATVKRLLLDPELAVGESYMDGGLEPLGCDIYDVLEILLANTASKGPSIMELRAKYARFIRRFVQNNTPHRSHRNVAHHYDLNGTLYSMFLDPDRNYSCAYYADGAETLEEAQAKKLRHIAAKLRLDRPGLRVLDIGSGWGAMAMYMASEFGAQVTGVTLSTEQLEEARARVAARGLSDRVRFELLDYRKVTGKFDRVVSIGMFEHVGVPHYKAFFDVVRARLEPDGLALLHSIGTSGPPAATNRWLGKYIFPGGYSPALSEVLPAIEKSGLVATDIEILRLHYAHTLREWRRRFDAKRETIKGLYDERFCRMFAFYLSGCELAFRYWGEMNFQIQLMPPEAPMLANRDYMIDDERKARLPLSQAVPEPQLEAAD